MTPLRSNNGGGCHVRETEDDVISVTFSCSGGPTGAVIV